MALTQNQKAAYLALVDNFFGNTLTSTQFALAKKDTALEMLYRQANYNTAAVPDQLNNFQTWLQTKPLAMTYLTKDGNHNTDFTKVIDGTVSLTTMASTSPTTYITLHAEDKTNEAALAGVLAFRAATVDSTFTDDDANLNAAASGTALSDAYIMGRFASGAWGATKAGSIFKYGTAKAIIAETSTSYDTLAEVVAAYDAWTHSVNKDTFHSKLDELARAGATVKYSQLLAYADDAADFNKYTSDAAIKLLTSTGGTWANMIALSDAEFSALTTAKAKAAIMNCGGTYTNMHAAYGVNAEKLSALLSENAIKLCEKGYSGFDFAGLSTGFGGSYTAQARVKFDNIINTANHPFFKAGVTYAHAATAYDNGHLECLQSMQTEVLTAASADTVYAELDGLVAGTPDHAGFEQLPLCA